MNTLLYQLLLSLTMQGMLWTILLIALCAGGTYAVELCKLGWAHRTQRPQTEEKQPTAPQEPVYYLVEKSNRRPKSGYGKPKPFHFKEE